MQVIVPSSKMSQSKSIFKKVLISKYKSHTAILYKMKPTTRAHENITMRTLSVCHDHEFKKPSRLLLELYLSAKFIIFTRHKKGAHILYTISKRRIKNQDND
jgi:hypothetical protein